MPKTTPPLVLLLLLLVSIQYYGCSPFKGALMHGPFSPGPCADTLEKARAFTWERHYEKALELLDDPTYPCSRSTENLLMRGGIFFSLEAWEKAKSSYEEVLKQSPKNPQAVVCLWFIDAIQKGYTDAVRDDLKEKALRYLEQDPEDEKGVYAAFLGLEGAKAVPEKTKLVQEYGHMVKDPSWRADMAEIYFYDTMRVDPAELPGRAEFFRSAFPHHRFRYNMAGMLLSSLTLKGKEAVDAEIRDILEKEPKNRVLNYLCAKAVLDANGDLHMAEKYIKRAIKGAKDPDPRDRYEYADDITWEKLMAETRTEYDALLGRIKFLQGDQEEAEKCFKKGLNHGARSYSLHLWFAEALEQSGDLETALGHYRAAAELMGSNDAVNGMRRILISRGIQMDPDEYFAGLEGIPRFMDVTDEAGVKGVSGKRVSWSDIDGDGFPDLVVSGRHVLKNNGDGTFSNATEQSGITHEFASGGILADFDKNRSPDLMAFTSKNGPRLYLNRTWPNTPIVFEDVTDSALPPWPDNRWPTEAAAVADVNGDGLADVYLANFEIPGPERALGAPDKLYLNQGKGAFRDATSHVIRSSQENMCGRGAAFSDFNGDGRQDLFVANYRLDPDFLFVNTSIDDADGFRLMDRADELGVRGINVQGAYGHSIGGAWGYLNNHWPALFVASLAHPRLLGLSDISALYLPKTAAEGFESHFQDLGFRFQETHSDPSFVDVDLDGDLDIFITCVYSGAPSFLYLNQNGRFSDVTWVAGVRVDNGWGAAWADYDKDGDMDLVVCSGDRPRLLRNEAQHLKMHWLKIKAYGIQSPTTGIGTRVTLHSLDSEKTWTREIQAGRGTGNQDEALAHFGLGHDKGPFTVTIRFPSGRKVVLDGQTCCGLIEVVEP